MYNINSIKHFFALVFVAIILVGCEQKQTESPIMKDTLTKNNMLEIAKKIADDNSFTKDDIEYYLNGMERLMNLDSLEGKTVKEVIESQKEIVRYVSVQNMKSSAARQQMNSNLKVDFKQKLKLENDSLNVDGVEFVLKNISGKTIKAVAGRIRFVNQQNQIVKLVDLSYDDLSLETGKDFDKKDFWLHDPNNQFDITFRNTERLTATWLPEKIVFADGTIISVKEEENQKPAEEAKTGESK